MTRDLFLLARQSAGILIKPAFDARYHLAQTLGQRGIVRQKAL